MACAVKVRKDFARYFRTCQSELPWSEHIKEHSMVCSSKKQIVEGIGETGHRSMEHVNALRLEFRLDDDDESSSLYRN